MCAIGRQFLDPRASEDSLARLRQEMLWRFEASLRAAGKVSPTADGSFDLNNPILTEKVGTEKLCAVHCASLVHGDIKAQNVIREEGRRIVLADFGLGRTAWWHLASKS